MRRLLVLVLLPLLLTGAAHGETGLFELEASEVSGQSARYVVTLRYENDGDNVDEATVTLVATGPEGVTIGPVTMTGAGEGRYEATVDYPGPGVWGVRIEATDPAAVLERAETIGAPTTTVTSTTEAPSSPTTTEAAAGGAGSSDENDSGGLRPSSMIAAGVAAVAIVFVLRRQRDLQRANRSAP